MLYIVESIIRTYGDVSSDIPIIQGIFKSEERAKELSQALGQRYNRVDIRIIATDLEAV